MIRFIIESLWLALLAYWLKGAWRVKRAKQVESRSSHLLRIALTIFTFTFLFNSWTRAGWLGKRFVPPSGAVAIAGAVVTALGVGLAAWARHSLGKNWSAAVTIKECHELIGTGPYARIRHPIYSGVILGLLGTALAIGEWRALIAVAVLFVSYFIKARKEEALLAREFGPAFEDHHSRTGVFLPRFR